MKNVLVLLVVAAFLAGCAGTKEVHERGWVGGSFQSVTALNDWGAAFSGHMASVHGIPEGVDAETALLVDTAHAATPIHHAGIAPGELVLAVDGEAVEDSLDLREYVEAIEPGTAVTLTIWRDGTIHEVPVTVGKESYEREGRISIGFALPFFGASTFDIWPFDDGIDILGLVRAKSYPRRQDLASVRGDYVAKLYGDPVSAIPSQERFDVRLLLLGVSKNTRIVGQAAHVD